jgi:hypothetical protein
MSEIKTNILRKIDLQLHQEQMEPQIETCRAYYGKILLIKEYNVKIHSKLKNGQKNDYIHNSVEMKKNISKYITE